MWSIFYIMAMFHRVAGTSSILDPSVRFLSYAWHLQRTWMWMSQFQMLIQLSRRILVGTVLATSMNTIKREWVLFLWSFCATSLVKLTYLVSPSLLKESYLLSFLIYVCYFLQGAFPLVDNGKSVIEVHQKKNYYIIPQNKLGQDIYIRATEIKGFKDIVKMPSGDIRPVKVPVLTNMLDSHLRGELCRNPRIMVTVIVIDAQVPFCLKTKITCIVAPLFTYFYLPGSPASPFISSSFTCLCCYRNDEFIWCHVLSVSFVLYGLHP